jgi:Zn-dependent peptidase ImmA (M78 family)
LSFRRGFKAEANRIALRIRQQMGLAAIDPIDPSKVCAHFEIKLIGLRELDCASSFLGRDRSAFSAVTVPCGRETAIVHNDSHHLYRQRSNICHELAHCFLGHRFTPPLTATGERARDGSIEAEANFLAGTLLITNEGALHIVKHNLESAAQERYGVSEAMLEFRLRVSGAYKILKRTRGR